MIVAKQKLLTCNCATVTLFEIGKDKDGSRMLICRNCHLRIPVTLKFKSKTHRQINVWWSEEKERVISDS